MTMEEITIRVSPKVAEAYRDSTEDTRQRLDALLELRLRDVLESTESVTDLMRVIGRNAQARGITPEILESILNDE
jgi:hypothetical protein